MPSLETFDLLGEVYVWQKTGDDGFGRPVLTVVGELPARVVLRRRDALDPQGNAVSTDATVVTGEALAVGSLLTEETPPGTGTFAPDGAVFQVVTTTRAPDVKGRTVRYEHGVVRYSEEFPADVVTG